MSDRYELDELIAHLVRTTRLSPAEVVRVVDDVFGFLDETPEQFVRRRHLALQLEGTVNNAIFTRIAAELAGRRFRAPLLTHRQIRRLIYG